VIEGFLVKLLTGGDDTLVQIPILGRLFKKNGYKAFFLIGMFISLSVIIILSLFFSGLLKMLPYPHYISAGLLVFLAIIVYFNLFFFKPKPRIEKKIEEEMKLKRVFHAFLAGFLAFFITAIDDAIVYSSVFLKSLAENLYVILGIVIAFVLEIAVIYFFSEKIAKLKYTKEITTVALLVLAVLVGLQVI